MAEYSSETAAENSPSYSFSFSESKSSPICTGLRNLGNTCFLNAFLQCFTHTVPLAQGLRACDHKPPCESRGFCLLCALRDHIEISLSSSGGIVSLLNLVENLILDIHPDSWHRLDDSQVTSVLSQEAYILFCLRQGTASARILRLVAEKDYSSLGFPI